MKTVAILALAGGMAAALAALITLGIRLSRKTVDVKWGVGLMVFAALFLLVAAVNMVLVILYL